MAFQPQTVGEASKVLIPKDICRLLRGKCLEVETLDKELAARLRFNISPTDSSDRTE
jgi:hypothetical protein